MKKERYYFAVVNENFGPGNNVEKGYLCIAKNKKQMKAAGMNMRLEWSEEDTYQGAQTQIRHCDETKETNVLSFSY